MDFSDRSLEDPKHLPYLEVDECRSLFIPNAAARFLLPPPLDDLPEIQKWLDFESAILAPTLAHFIGSNHKFESLKTGLNQCLKRLDSVLADDRESICGVSRYNKIPQLDSNIQAITFFREKLM